MINAEKVWTDFNGVVENSCLDILFGCYRTKHKESSPHCSNLVTCSRQCKIQPINIRLKLIADQQLHFWRKTLWQQLEENRNDDECANFVNKLVIVIRCNKTYNSIVIFIERFLKNMSFETHPSQLYICIE